MTTEVVATVNYLKEQAGFPVARSLVLLGLPRAAYFRWSASGGKQPRPAGTTPKSRWLLPEEREAIIAYRRQHPEFGFGYSRAIIHHAVRSAADLRVSVSLDIEQHWGLNAGLS